MKNRENQFLSKPRSAVVLASGGFSRDLTLRQLQDPRLDDKFESTNQPGATGEVLLAACQAGAMDVQMDWIQLAPGQALMKKVSGTCPSFVKELSAMDL